MTTTAVNTDSEEMSRRARERNRKTLRISLAENGFILTDMGTGQARVYEDAGFETVGMDNDPRTVLEHLQHFFKKQMP